MFIRSMVELYEYNSMSLTVQIFDLDAIAYEARVIVGTPRKGIGHKRVHAVEKHTPTPSRNRSNTYNLRYSVWEHFWE